MMMKSGFKPAAAAGCAAGKNTNSKQSRQINVVSARASWFLPLSPLSYVISYYVIIPPQPKGLWIWDTPWASLGALGPRPISLWCLGLQGALGLRWDNLPQSCLHWKYAGRCKLINATRPCSIRFSLVPTFSDNWAVSALGDLMVLPPI